MVVFLSAVLYFEAIGDLVSRTQGHPYVGPKTHACTTGSKEYLQLVPTKNWTPPVYQIVHLRKNKIQFA